jgi:alcohol dehydrogenase class IV
MRTTWSFYSAGQLVFGVGAVRQAAAIFARHGWRRALCITDTALVQHGFAARLQEPLEAAGVEFVLFDGGEAEPSIEIVANASAIALDSQPDVILGLGGGSNMDLSKATAVVARHGGRPEDYFGFDRVPGPVAPLVCVPTTAGTGSEVSHAAVLTDRRNKIKVSMLSNWLRPAVALVDPELTWSCPPKVTADSGIDALTHAIEAYTATDFDEMPVPEGEPCAYEGRFPLADCLAEKAITLIAQNLVAAVHEPDNHEARNAMALAATLAGLAFSNEGVALVHGLEYPLGGALHCSHGAGNGLLLPYVMQFNLSEREATFGRIAELMGATVEGLAPAEAAQQAIDAVIELRRKVGIPSRIRELGGSEDQLPGFAEKSYAIERLRCVNPRPSTQSDLLGILKAAW